jgi:RNA polymerase sigma-70 factor (ECF subfamily)
VDVLPADARGALTASEPSPAPEVGGDTTWFAEAVGELLPELYGTAQRFTRNAADAEDLVAEAVARAWAGRERLENRASFRPWMYRILTNAWTSAWRAAKTRPAAEPVHDENAEERGFSLFERLHQPFLLWWNTPEQEFLNKLLREDLERAIDALPDAFRPTVILVDVQGLSYEETARTLDIPIGTVRSRLARGRSLLQRALWRHGLDAGLVKTGTPVPRSTNV